jgi:MoaE-MoaD fusion protein
VKAGEDSDCMTVAPVSATIFYTLGMKVTVLLFASVAEAVGKRTLSYDAPEGACVIDIRDGLLERYPALGRFAPNLMYAVDEEYAELDTPVGDGATLALIPPVSGGSTGCFE